MALTATRGGGDFKRTPPGNYLARCYRVIDLGTQKTSYKGKDKWARKVLFGWEIHDEDAEGNPLVMEDGKPMAVSSRYTLSLGDNAHMKKMLESWRGKSFTEEELNGFDVKAVLGAWCMVNITHRQEDGKTYEDVSTVTPVPKAIKQAGLPKPVNELQFFEVTDPDKKVFATFSEKLQETINACKELNGKGLNAEAKDSAKGGEDRSDVPDNLDDDIPF